MGCWILLVLRLEEIWILDLYSPTGKDTSTQDNLVMATSTNEPKYLEFNFGITFY